MTKVNDSVLTPHRSTEHFAVAEQVYAAMETGNYEQARTLIEEYSDAHPEEARALRLALVRDYGKEV